ncbi:MAG: HU family DNA-binding protein [Bacteroidales bacterium]|nr:HU family DNA-binding protein [Bacteroidales bacterium]MDY3911720.1 HU family DNA-binding protein [Sodaliphilus sp.]
MKKQIIMNKTELVNAIASEAKLTKAEAKVALEATINAISNALVEGDKVALVGFGTFSVNERPARNGINPRTKEIVPIAAKKVAKFKAGAELAEKVNK